jgi:CBS domain containing-hemolysin-like protein
VASATAATSLGIAMMGAIVPGIFDNFTIGQLSLFLLLVVVPVTIVIAYLLPRSLTLPRAERAAEVLRPVLHAWSGALGIVLPARSANAADDVQALTRDGVANGLSDGTELVMVGGVMTFAERPVRAVMTPRTDVIAVAHDASYHEVLDVFAESGYTRLPMYRGTLDDIVGMVHAFDLFKLQPGDPVPVRAVSFAPESRFAGDLLIDMQRERRHFAVVLDEFGGTAGIVTLEDLLEALVGEISDEDDGEVATLVAAGAPLDLDGTATPIDVAEHFDVSLPRAEAATFGGLIAELAGRIPAAGERFSMRGLEIDILQASPTRIERLMVRRSGATASPLDRADA